ncbi:MAG: DNA circularization N-terminal domain-containing protein [Treponema sp.]|nr:DNA circularization N-terminal domain-containing protein [Treponema sp.]
MAWNDEIQEAAYNSPSGKRQTFIYENVSRETDLKTASFVFPELDGALIQSLGLGGRTFPLKCIFSGASCNKEADSFEKLLSERGHGILEHPVYGKINVVPTGKIKRTDNILNGANESSVEVTFSETLVDKEESTSEVATADKLDAAMDEYETSAAADFAENIYTDSIEDKMQLQAVMKANTNSTFKGVEKMVKAAPKNKGRINLLQWYDSAKRFINSIIDNVDKIGTFANEVAITTIKMIRLPSQITSDAFSKLAGYQLMIKDIANNVKADPFGTKAVTNQWAAATLAWGSMVAALSYGCAKTAAEQSVNQGANNFESSGDSAEDDSDFSEGSANGGFTSRSDVLETAAQIAASFAEYSAYIDSQNKKNAFVDTGETYEKLLNVVTYSLRSLEETAFCLPVTRIIKLDRDRQLFELLTELYGKDGFNRQNQFINDNKLTADEIVLIPMGREVRYYA